jgi:arylsulfatase A-like enzyme
MNKYLVICLLLLSNVVAAKDQQPNILFVLADDFRWDSFAHLSDLGLKTPNLDKLANKSIRFTKSYNTTAICLGSRAVYVSGLNEFATGTNFAHGSMNYDVWQKSYPALLKKSGYFTGFVGKFGFHVNNENGKKGTVATIRDDFDYWGAWLGQGDYKIANNPEAEAWFKFFGGKKEHATHAIGLMSEDFIKRGVKSGKPFNLSVSFKAPHGPYAVDPRYKEVYQGQEFAKPENYGPDANSPKQAISGRPTYLGKKWLTEYDKQMYGYHSMIYGLDQALGRIMATLEEQGVSDNTVVIFAADNGHFNGSKGMSGKLYAYEEGTRSPTMIFDPRRKSSEAFETTDVLSGSIDIAPTILALADVGLPEKMHGKSILPILTTEKSKQTGTMLHKSLLLMQVWGKASAQSLAVVTPTHKYIHWFYGADEFERTEELFDLTKDSNESTNLTKHIEAAPVLKNMRQQYDEHMATWAQEGVNDRGYPKYLKLADRHTPFETNSQADIDEMYKGKGFVRDANGNKIKNKKKKKNKNKNKNKTNNVTDSQPKHEGTI